MTGRRIRRWLALVGLAVTELACGPSGSSDQPATGEPGIERCDLLLRDVTVFDARGPLSEPVFLERAAVVIADDRIEAIVADRSLPPDPDCRKILDLPGRFVLPGLVDTHAHVTILPMDERGRIVPAMVRGASEQALRTLLAFGVTTVRNPAAPTDDAVVLRRDVASGAIVGPQIVTSGEALNRTASPFGPFVATPDEASVRAEVRRQAERGVDWIKVYASLAPDLVGAAIDEAHRIGVPVVGHLQRTTWTDAARLGIDAITHGAPWSVEYLPADAREGYRGGFRDRLTWLERVDFDGPAIQEMLDALVEEEVIVDPTLVAYFTKFYADDPAVTEHPDLELAPRTSLDIWRRASFVADWTAEDHALAHRLWPRVLELTRRMHAAGVRLTAGSDLPNPWVVPGVSLHQEIGLLVDAGIPPDEVLRIATRNGAEALGLAASTGTVEAGKEADLVVLRADPLAAAAAGTDLGVATRDIELVVSDGVVHRPEVLRAREKADQSE